MKSAALMVNTIQEYAWGSETMIPELLGKPSEPGKPKAELWMGAHPKAPSNILIGDGRVVSLVDLIASAPLDILGEAVLRKFGNQLPFLFKVLAVEKALSIQAHPDRRKAMDGFEAENRMGIPLEAPNRNYRDTNHKPECLSALTPFWGLCGFRPLKEVVSRLETILSLTEKALKGYQALHVGSGSGDLKSLLHWLLSLKNETRIEMIESAVSEAGKKGEDDPVSHWILRLHQEYPTDIGVLSPIFLNLIHLEPGQAIFLEAGQLHAYLEGLGIELMANSDNVLRGGLTPKHIDTSELLSVVQFKETFPFVYAPESVGVSESAYPISVEEFRLSILSPQLKKPYRSGRGRSVEILICTEGLAEYRETESGLQISLQKGDVLLIPAAVAAYQIKGVAKFYRASVPV